MQTVTETKYKASDGRTFTDENKAKLHEVELLAKSLIPVTDGEETAGKLTMVRLLSMLATNSKPFVDLLTTFIPETAPLLAAMEKPAEKR